ncbi:MAG TPA: tRNA 2-selenouridine(34) synthase MnmH [Cyclobacteriaceae bacterium]|nr:tRNA 2-selenouridine(34) synthase MnmH [Cyclobacteriaceae bacterium]
MPISITDFFDLRQHHPVVDVRSEGEFKAGHIGGAINIPLLNNEERVVVGTTYKQKGQGDAIKEGFKLVGPRLEGIINEAERVAGGKEILVHCWRGGMRSNNFCQFVGMAGIKAQSLSGGYKAYRQLAFDSFKRPLPIILLTGCTGSGKSEVLRSLAAQGEQILDLEDLACHKGSAFGGLLMPPQPTTEQFQNDLFEAISKLDTSKRVWVEDESLAIGKIFLPEDFWLTMKQRPLVKMDVSKEVRIQRLVNEYGPADRATFLEIMGKITKKLGGQHFKDAKQKLLQGDMAATIENLLTYYDKAYLGSINGRKEKLQLVLPWDGKDVDGYASKLVNEVSSLVHEHTNT